MNELRMNRIAAPTIEFATGVTADISAQAKSIATGRAPNTYIALGHLDWISTFNRIDHLAANEVPVMLLPIGAERPGNWAQKPRRPLADVSDFV